MCCIHSKKFTFSPVVKKYSCVNALVDNGGIKNDVYGKAGKRQIQVENFSKQKNEEKQSKTILLLETELTCTFFSSFALFFSFSFFFLFVISLFLA